MAICFGAGGRIHLLDDQRREEIVHLARLVIELELPEELHVPGVGGGEDFLVSLPGGALGVVAVGEPIGPRTQDTSGRECEQER